MATVILQKARKKRIEEGHPWVFRNEVERIEGDAEPGDIVTVTNHQGRFLGSGYYNPQSQIVVRIVDFSRPAVMDAAFFAERFRRCLAHRERFAPDADSCRMVYGEADFLPGLIVDKFADVLVVQILTLGMDVRRRELTEALAEVFRPAGIYERSDVPVRELEGLAERTGLLYGECPDTVDIVENGLKIEVDIKQGQKTGYFFDQRENRASIRPLMQGWGARSGIRLEERESEGEPVRVPVNASGKEVAFPYWDGATVLECFAHTGSFTLHACRYGAKKVTCLDVSEHAIASARRNVELNGFEDRVEFVTADAFDYLRSQVQGLAERKERSLAADKKVDTSKKLASGGRTWDVVILDPPAFAKNRKSVEGACRGYKDINLHGMKLVNEGGYLVTASCSYHVSAERFLQTVHEAAVDAGKILRLVEFRAAGKDHPRILGVDEGDYLKFAVFEVTSR
ncbi:class I SAM-dependent rRNA methyltransferase [Gorillibacterium sp. sgz500922]|uniref:class I SAM-dependent rRNA methyltransferase n=1 Tax=Gorillibacterium sp. sgz500922 TaxID=3446694 RepID=UPI003F661136